MIWLAALAAFVFMAVAALRAKAPAVRTNWLLGLVALLALAGSVRLGARALAVPALLLGIRVASQALNRASSRESGADSTGQKPMTRREALRVLGLEEGASREAIAAAHRNLIKKVHPDRGGSGFLAQQVNEAKKVLESS